MADDFGMAFDFGMSVVDEGVVAVGKFDSAFICVPLPIATIDPFPPFSGMAKAAPFGQFPEQFFIQVVENFFGRTGFVVVGPAPNNGVKFADESRLSRAAIVSDDLFEAE